MARKPVVLCILDGWGLREEREANAPALADTPTFDRLWANSPHATLTTHGPVVGLPRGQMGNSEVGHTNIGAGRTVAMDLGQIDLAMEDGSFDTRPALLDFIQTMKDSGGTAHLIGLASPGGVHAHQRHMARAAHVLVAAGVPVAIHAITDGRDVAPRSAADQIAQLPRRPAGGRADRHRQPALLRQDATPLESASRRPTASNGWTANRRGRAEDPSPHSARLTNKERPRRSCPSPCIGTYDGMKDARHLLPSTSAPTAPAEIPPPSVIQISRNSESPRGPGSPLRPRHGSDYSESHDRYNDRRSFRSPR